MYYRYKTKKTKMYELKLENMRDKSFDYKFKNNWDYYNGYTLANFERSTALLDYKENLSRAFKRVEIFNKFSKSKQRDLLNNPFSCGNYHIKVDMGYIDFYKDTKKKK